MEIVDFGDFSVPPNNTDQTRSIIKNAVQQISEKTLPVILGGDHYLTYPSFAGYAQTTSDATGITHPDAHSDTVETNSI